MMLGAWGNTDRSACLGLIDRALGAGINFIDSADMYAQGECEEIVGEALAVNGRRDDVVLATKFHYPTDSGDINARGNSRRWILRAVEDSLRRLKTDWIDLYQVHGFDPSVDHEETLGVLTDLVHQGKIRYIGSSRFPVSRVVEAQWVAHDRHVARYVCEQPPYSMLIRGIEDDLLPTCQRHRIGVITWSPLVGGWLSGQWRKDRSFPDSVRAHMLPQRFNLSNPENQAKLEAADALGRLADQAGMTLIHMALAFVLRHPAVTSAIVGPRTLEQLEAQLNADDLELSPDVLAEIDRIVPPGTNLSRADARGGGS
jgi:aryl-alcohol dehydrogenase-like predicted oxidoreductase